MKANELMIGDWVMISPWETEWHHDRIIGINYNSWQGDDYVDWIDCESWDELSLNEIKPIPLTAEILEKNGWKLIAIPGVSEGTEDWAIWPTDSDIEIPFRLQKGYDGHAWWLVVGIGGLLAPIDYVHELQHALRLCEIEKEIEL